MSRILRMRKLFYAQNAVKDGAIRRKGAGHARTPFPRRRQISTETDRR